MNIRRLENIHVALWLLKDTSWCSGWEIPAFSMVLPTLIVAGLIAWESRREAEDLVHNIAVCLWIVANIIWMTGEFFYEDMTRGAAKTFFFAGMLLLVVFYVRRSFRNGGLRRLADRS